MNAVGLGKEVAGVDDDDLDLRQGPRGHVDQQGGLSPEGGGHDQAVAELAGRPIDDLPRL